MAEYIRKEITIQRFELKLPSYGVEVSKAISAAYQRFKSVHGREPSEDQIHVEVEPGDMGEFWLVVFFYA